MLACFTAPVMAGRSLALDLAEEFRSLVADSVVIGLLNNGEITPSDFLQAAGAVSLSAEGCRRVVSAYERLQYSVFLCELTVAELAELESAVTGVMNLHEG